MLIPYDDFGGEGRHFHFAHANGYPPLAYQLLLTGLSEHYRVRAMHARPLRQPEPARGDLPDWSWMVSDLFSYFVTHGLQNIVGMGHSMGAVATLLSALERPEQSRGLILLDPTLLPRWTATGFGLIKKLRLVYRHPMLRTTVRRRSVFADREGMFAHYRRKRVFSRTRDEDLRTIVRAHPRERWKLANRERLWRPPCGGGELVWGAVLLHLARRPLADGGGVGAARGDDGRTYPWGNESPSESFLNFAQNEDDTKPIGSYPDGACPYGVYDMAGNVWEWVADWYDGNYYGNTPDANLSGPESGSNKVVRGGSWCDASYYVRAALRSSLDPSFPDDDAGFRCASSP